jgi:hypothetical protein
MGSPSLLRRFQLPLTRRVKIWWQRWLRRPLCRNPAGCRRVWCGRLERRCRRRRASTSAAGLVLVFGPHLSNRPKWRWRQACRERVSERGWTREVSTPISAATERAFHYRLWKLGQQATAVVVAGVDWGLAALDASHPVLWALDWVVELNRERCRCLGGEVAVLMRRGGIYPRRNVCDRLARHGPAR